MDKELVAALARLAGLDRALADFPDDVAAAAAQATLNEGVLRLPESPTDEPWPPMRAAP